MDHRHLNERFTGFRQQFIIFTQAPVAIEPSEGALHNPAFGDDHKAFDSVRAFGNLQADRPLRPQGLDPINQWPSISPISPNVPQPRKFVPDTLQELLRAVAVLDTGSRHHDCQDEPEGIDEDVPLAAFDLFAGIVPTDPPFSVVLTD
jgi:hypothetical protein